MLDLKFSSGLGLGLGLGRAGLGLGLGLVVCGLDYNTDMDIQAIEQFDLVFNGHFRKCVYQKQTFKIFNIIKLKRNLPLLLSALHLM
jgi:hypothetical protein